MHTIMFETRYIHNVSGIFVSRRVQRYGHYLPPVGLKTKKPQIPSFQDQAPAGVGLFRGSGR